MKSTTVRTATGTKLGLVNITTGLTKDSVTCIRNFLRQNNSRDYDFIGGWNSPGLVLRRSIESAALIRTWAMTCLPSLTCFLLPPKMSPHAGHAVSNWPDLFALPHH
jgi:hypothetical protein